MLPALPAAACRPAALPVVTLAGMTRATVCLPIISALRWGPAKDFFAKRGMHGALANDDASAQQFAVSKSQVKWLDETMLAAVRTQAPATAPYFPWVSLTDCLSFQGSPEFICGDRYTIADLQLFSFLSWVSRSFSSVAAQSC